MKKSLILGILGLGVGAVSSYGQGTVTFQNYFTSTSPTIDYAASNVPNGKAGLSLGGSFAAELGWFNGVTANASLITLIPSTITYFGYDGPGQNSDPDGTPGPSGNGTGWYFGPTPALDDGSHTSPSGTVVTLEIFAFNNGSYSAATVAGNSALFQVTLGGGVNAPAKLTGAPNFTVANVAPVPEPTTLALAGLGGLASLGMLRRKTA